MSTSSLICTVCGVNPIAKGYPSRFGMCRICRRKISVPVERTSTPKILLSEIDRLKQMFVNDTSIHLYLLTSPAHELLQKFRVGITNKSLEELVNEFKPYMMDVVVHRFNKITSGDTSRTLQDLFTSLSQYKCDQSGWFESKKDVITEIFDDYVRGTYNGSDEQFVVDLIHLGQAVAHGADKLELRMKLERLNDSGKKWLKLLGSDFGSSTI